MNKSSVEAVDEAQKKQKEAEKKMEQAETKARNEKKRAELEIRKAKKEVKARTEKMRDTEYFWGMGYITVILFVIIQIRICVQIVNTGIFAKLKDKGYLNTAPAVL